MSEKEKGDNNENKKELSVAMGMDLQKLGQAYNIPFQKIMDTIDVDRKLAIQNYEILKNKVVVDKDDSSAAKEQMNKAMELIIASTEKLTSAISSASKLWGDTVKAVAMQSVKQLSPQEMKEADDRRREKLLNDKT